MHSIHPDLKLLEPYIKAHDYRMYSRYMRVLAVDSTFIKTLMKGSGSYKGISDGMKMHIPAIVFPFTVPMNAYISSANVSDSSLFDNIIEDMDNKILYSSILVFDLEYYNLERFKQLTGKNILFVSRCKRRSGSVQKRRFGIDPLYIYFSSFYHSLLSFWKEFLFLSLIL